MMMNRNQNRPAGRIGTATRACAMAALAAGVLGSGTTASADRLEYTEERDLLEMQIGQTDDFSLYMGLTTVGRVQGFDQRRVSVPQRPGLDGEPVEPLTPGSLEWGPQYPFGSMDFKAVFNDGDIVTYWEFFIANRSDATKLQGSQGYLLFRGLPGGTLDAVFRHIEVKAGQFEVNFGDHIYRRSANARVQQNALVGNNLVDPRSTEAGVEIRTRNGPVQLSLGVTDGTEGEDFSRGRGIGYNAKLSANPVDALRLSLSGYYVDHSSNPAGRESSQSNMHRTIRDGGPYGGILDAGGAPGQLFIGAGQKVTASQLDATTRLGALELYGNVGYAEDADVNGSAEGAPKDAYWYYTVEGVYNVSDRLFGAVRYSGASAEEVRGQDSDGYVNRYQAGLGYWLSSHILAKVEYVYQEYRDFEDGQVVSGVDAGRDPAFHGLLVEASLAF